MNYAVRAVESPSEVTVAVPPDLVVGTLAPLLALVSETPIAMTGLDDLVPGVALEAALAALGAPSVRQGERRIYGAARSPSSPAYVDCGGSKEMLHGLLGLISGQSRATALYGRDLVGLDFSWALNALISIGATTSGIGTVPVVVGFGAMTRSRLQGGTFRIASASACAKIALLFAALVADGPVTLIEESASDGGCERLMEYCGLPISRAGAALTLDASRWSRRLVESELAVPGDPELAVLMCAAAVCAGVRSVEVHDVSSRWKDVPLVEVLQMMGCEVRETNPTGGLGASSLCLVAENEPRGVGVEPGLAFRLGERLPVVAALATRARGATRIEGIGQLAHEDRIRLHEFVTMLERGGVACTVDTEHVLVPGQVEIARDVVQTPMRDLYSTWGSLLLGIAAPSKTSFEVSSAHVVSILEALVPRLRRMGIDVRSA